MENLSRFEGKVVVINGASRGIGSGIAKRFAAEGATVVVTANEERVHDVAQGIREIGGKALWTVPSLMEGRKWENHNK